jgi:hypothetical protein
LIFKAGQEMSHMNSQLIYFVLLDERSNPVLYQTHTTAEISSLKEDLIYGPYERQFSLEA